MEEPLEVWRFDWTDYLPGYPRLWELLLLLMLVGTIMALGQVVKRFWTDNNDSVPIPVSLAIWVASFFLYFSVLGFMYNQYTEDLHKTTVLVWGIICWIPGVAFTSWTVVNSLAHRTIDRIGPFSALIEEPSEFSEARKLALRGDIDGAVRRYRAYAENHAMAMFEAGRLLKSQDRYAEAAVLFDELMERYGDDKVVWAEATYQLAKVKHVNLHQIEAAQDLFRSLVEQVPGTRFGMLAGQELARMQALGNGYSSETPKAAPAPEDPFFEPTDVRVIETQSSRAPSAAAPSKADPLDQPVPAADPFFLAREAFRANEAAAESAGAGKVSKAKAKPKAKAAAKKPAAKKKAAASGRKSKPSGK